MSKKNVNKADASSPEKVAASELVRLLDACVLLANVKLPPEGRDNREALQVALNKALLVARNVESTER